MGKKTRSFIDGEIVFREGEAGNSAFVIKRGQVALSKDTSHGPVEIEVLEKGEYFGEMGILNGGKRTLTAIAVGDLSVEVVRRKEFEKNAQKNPDQAPASIPQTIPRLRQTGTAIIATGNPANSDNPSPPAPSSWFSRLFSLRPRTTSQIEVRIIPLIGENGGQHARALFTALSRRDGLSARIISADGSFAQKTMPKNVIAACCNES
nr:cyclic nucleotide-binding domain-containing protein [Alphaproteobacteria bacterium]